MKLLFLLCLLGSLNAFAFDPGTYVSAIGDTVHIRNLQSGQPRVTINTYDRYGGSGYCSFAGNFLNPPDPEEATEYLHYIEDGCAVKIEFIEDNEALKVTHVGCQRYCTGGVNLRVSRAAKKD